MFNIGTQTCQRPMNNNHKIQLGEKSVRNFTLYIMLGVLFNYKVDL